MIVVRKALPEEHKEILQVSKQSKHTKDFSNRMMFSSEAAYSKGWIHVVEHEGEIRGFCCILEKVRAPETVLYFIGVAQEAKGLGLGKKLIEHIMATTRHRRLVLNVNKQNEEARAFYDRLGFTVAGDSLGGEGLALFKEWREMAKQRVINIRGTSGSGKSTLIRRLVELYPEKEPVHVADRKQPLFYKLRGDGLLPLSLLGHYETACGGCDTIPSMDRIYELVRERLAEGDSVLYEGLLISSEANRAVALHTDGFDLTVVRLSTPLELCVDSVNQRRWAKNPDKPGVNPKNTEAKFKQTLATCKKLDAAGIKVVEADRDGAFHAIKQLLEA